MGSSSVSLPAPSPGVGVPGRPWRGAARGHAGVLAVLALGGVIRIAVELAYRPALLFSDSWGYLSMAHSGMPVGILPSRPSGYALLLRLLALTGRDLLAVSVVQHVAGLAIGALVYAVLRHVGVGKALATVAAAVVVFDSYAIALEQFIMAEAFFMLLLVGALALTVIRRESPGALMTAGALLAAACTVRTAGLFVAPVWCAYLLWSARDRRRLLMAAAGLLLPLCVYASWHAWRTDGSFALDQSQGWFLYGRVGQFADCQGADVPRLTQPLCDLSAEWRPLFTPGLWVWGVGSPAVRLFAGTPDHFASSPSGEARTARDNQLLEEFALAIIRAHPLAYATAAGADFLRFFDPGASPARDADGATVTFPSAPLTDWVYAGPRHRYVPGYVPRVRWPASLLVSYQKVLRAPRLLLGALAVVALIALLVPLVTPLQLVRRAEIFLLTGSGLAMLLGAAALVGFVVRYLVPSVPLLVAGGLLAGHELAQAARVARLERADRPGGRALVAGGSVTRMRAQPL